MKIWSDEKCGWLALQMIPGLGSVACKSLLDTFDTPEQIFQASMSDLSEVEGVRKEVAKNIANMELPADPSQELRRVEKCGAHDPPILLYLKGKNIPQNLTFIGVVGSRHPTPYGIKSGEKIGQGLGRRGLGVVSGMARGIDSAAHWGCLAGRGFTLAVLGTGIDITYPASNKKLANKITREGAMISEFPLGTPPEPKNFPIRNRIISGLSQGVVVVEATKQSGSLITASLALEQGREVFAVPGSIHSFKSRGCHFLIKQGATLIENSDDILDELGLNYDYAPKTDTFKEGPLISRQGNLPPGRAASILMRMELKGIIRQLPGKMFVR
jgi:DNA processing protein